MENYYILRLAGRVKRYHTVPTIGEQSVGEHSFGVLLILMYVFDGEVPPELVKAAMFHDLSEIHTGDIPATTKWRSPTLVDELTRLEQVFEDLNGISVQLTDEERKYLKFADMMELVQYCIDQRKLGNTSLNPVLGRGVEFLLKLSRENKLNDRALGMLDDAVAFWHKEQA